MTVSPADPLVEGNRVAPDPTQGHAASNTVAPKVTVIVPHYRDLPRLDLCLQALGGQTFPAHDFEIIVADNNSPEGEAAVSQVIAGRARLVIVREKGAGAARNGGVSQARGSVLAFTDSDCRPEAEWLAEGVKALATSDLIGGRMTVLVEDPTAMTPVEAFERVFAFDNEAYVTRKGFTVTANLFCPRSVFDSVGGFVTSVVSEDYEWCLRAAAAGFRIGYSPSSVVGHPARRTWEELLTKWRRTNAEAFGLVSLGKRARIRWLLRTLLLPASAVAHTPKALTGRGLYTFSQRLGALGVLYRLRFWRFADSLRLFFAAKAKSPVDSPL